MREVQSRLGRLFLAALAVALGVAFVTMSFVLTDTSKVRFQSLFAELDASADLLVMSPAAVASGAGLTGQQIPISSTVLDQIRAVPGVGLVDGRLLGPASLLDPKGKPVRSQFGSTIAMSWSKEADLTPLTVRSGRRPNTAEEFALDARTVQQYRFSLGDTVLVGSVGAQASSVPFQREMRLVGILGFGSADSFGSTTVIGLAAETAADFFRVPNSISAALIKVDPTADTAEVQARLRSQLGGLAVLTTAEAQAETNKQISEISDRASQLLVLFASLGVISGAVMIANTFSMIISQRMRALALLRSLGASRRQVVLLLGGEALVVALVGMAVGVVLGVAAASGILSLISTYVFQLPNIPVVVQLRTLVVAAIVGIAGTGAGVVLPAVRSGRIPPVPAMADAMINTGKAHFRWRLMITVLALLGAAALILTSELAPPLISTPEMGVGMALGAAVLIGLAASVLAALGAPRFAALLSNRLGAGIFTLIAIFGVGLSFGSNWDGVRISTSIVLLLVLIAGLRSLFSASGVLAGRNAGRHAIRTGRTAVSLMIGIAVLSVLAVLVSSLKGTISESLLNGVRAPVIVADPNSQFIPPETEVALRDGGVSNVIGMRLGRAQLGDITIEINSLKPEDIDRVYDLDLSSGSAAGLGSGQVLLNAGRAEALGVQVGDSIQLGNGLFGVQQSLVVAGIFERTVISPFGAVDIITTPETSMSSTTNSGTTGIYVLGSNNQDASALKRKVIEVLDAANITQPSVYTREEYAEHSRSQYDAALIGIYGLVIIGAIIALLSIANTMFLSVYERTREVGLLRGIGMSRRQIRSMIRGEGLIIAVLGGVLGTITGGVGALLLVRALRTQGLNVIAVPWAQLAFFIGIAGASGVVAAVLPAWRAARLPVLDAISVELHDSGDRN